MAVEGWNGGWGLEWRLRVGMAVGVGMTVGGWNGGKGVGVLLDSRIGPGYPAWDKREFATEPIPEATELMIPTVKNFMVYSLAAVAVAAGIFASAGLNLGGGGGVI